MPLSQLLGTKHPIKIRSSCIAKSTFFPSHNVDAALYNDLRMRWAEERGQGPPPTNGLVHHEQASVSANLRTRLPEKIVPRTYGYDECAVPMPKEGGPTSTRAERKRRSEAVLLEYPRNQTSHPDRALSKDEVRRRSTADRKPALIFPLTDEQRLDRAILLQNRHVRLARGHEESPVSHHEQVDLSEDGGRGNMPTSTTELTHRVQSAIAEYWNICLDEKKHNEANGEQLANDVLRPIEISGMVAPAEGGPVEPCSEPQPVNKPMCDQVPLPRYLSNSEEQAIKLIRHGEVDTDPILTPPDAEFAHNLIENYLFAHDLSFPAYHGLKPPLNGLNSEEEAGNSEQGNGIKGQEAANRDPHTHGKGIQSYEVFAASRGKCPQEGPMMVYGMVPEVHPSTFKLPTKEEAVAGAAVRALKGRGQTLSTPGRDHPVAVEEDSPQPRLGGLTVTEYVLHGNTRTIEALLSPAMPGWYSKFFSSLTQSGAHVNIAPCPPPGLPLRTAIYSRKVFVGGLPGGMFVDYITDHFILFGPLVVDWPHKVEFMTVYPPKGFVFLHFQDEISVKRLLNASDCQDDRFFHRMTLPGGGFKRVEIIPWKVKGAEFCPVRSGNLNVRTTVFIGGVPRPCTASRLAKVLGDLFGGVVFAAIDIDEDYKYPKGSGRVCFSSKNCYINAISARFVEMIMSNCRKVIEIKPYVMDDQLCDICHGDNNSAELFAVYYCANIKCLKYHCSLCWAKVHCEPTLKFHKPLIKEARNQLYEKNI